MEGNPILLILDLNSISDLVLIKTMTSSPLFSSIVTFYALILLYIPHHFLPIVFSPVPIITGIILLSLLRLGSIQRFEGDEHREKENNSYRRQTEYSETKECNQENRENRGSIQVQEQIPSLPEDQDHNIFNYQSETDSGREMGFDLDPCFEDLFVEWNVKAPLEVIYEEYEGEANEVDPNENDPNSNQNRENQAMGLERQPSLSLYYPESDSDSSSEGDISMTGNWDSPEAVCFRWDEEDREGLIEIALDDTKTGLDFHGDHEEENLIEIDISPTRNNEFCNEKYQFSGEVRFS